ncbi:MAG: electron transfer flavoprotein subunit alpha/FixB family protein [Alphaproteobacteria bacterium]
MSTLLLADHADGQLSPETAKALSAAAQLGEPVHILVAGQDTAAVAAAAAGLAGVEKVLQVDDPSLANALAEPLAALILSLAEGYNGFVAAASAAGKNVMPRVAALLDVMQLSDIVAVDGPAVFRRPIYAGNAIQTVETSDAKKVITVRTSAFAAAENGGAAPIETANAATNPGGSRFVRAAVTGGDRPELTSAPVVVSGGRALGSKEKFDALLLPLADKLNGAVGASRAAVDAGYAPNDWQVGQTGKIVAPDLYIACGISGAIQHVAGMRDSRVIVAINKDPEAPIFQIADYGLIGDIFEILPALNEAL